MGPRACLGALHKKNLLLILGNEPRFLGGPPSLVTTQPYEKLHFRSNYKIRLANVTQTLKCANATVESLYHILKIVVIRVLKHQKPANLPDIDIGFYINRRPWIKLDLE